MAKAAREGDLGTGHGGFPPRQCIQGSPDVTINGKAAHRTNDAWAVHVLGNSAHDSTMGQGSGTVTVNGMPLARVGDPVNCGSTVMLGSPDVEVGG
tara:strand:+ start:36186 stop:36473 length:288 start_codon:yes stop_codon:yes gene_type:complete